MRKFTKLYSNIFINVNINKYKIKWLDPSASQIQTAFKTFVYPYWKNCTVLEEFRIPGSLLECDFLNLDKNIAVEINGQQHNKFIKYFHKNKSNFIRHVKRDVQKYDWLIKNKFQVLELETEDINNLSLEYIKQKFNIELI